MTPDAGTPLGRLTLFDPTTADRVKRIIDLDDPAVDMQTMLGIVDDIIWAYAQEPGFGDAVAGGYASLAVRAADGRVSAYHRALHRAGPVGPTAGRMMARHLAPVLKYGNRRMVRQFFELFEALLEKGSYTLKGPLEMLHGLLKKRDLESAMAYMSLLKTAYTQPIDYRRSIEFTASLPRAVAAFTTDRALKTSQLARVIQEAPDLADAFCLGMQRGLDLLSCKALVDFVSAGLSHYRRHPKKGYAYMALDSAAARETLQKKKIAVSLDEVKEGLRQYLSARTGMPLNVSPLPPEARPSNSDSAAAASLLVFSDRGNVYLPPTIAVFPHLSENVDLYKSLVRLEAGLFEFGTFDFDLVKAMDIHPVLRKLGHPDIENSKRAQKDALSDVERFSGAFPDPGLAMDLFTLFEHGRVFWLMRQRYPGLVQRVLPLLRKESRRLYAAGRGHRGLNRLYAAVVLGLPPENNRLHPGARRRVLSVMAQFQKTMAKRPVVESSALLVALNYHGIEKHFIHPYRLYEHPKMPGIMVAPFGRHLRPDWVFNTCRSHEMLARRIYKALHERGICAYPSEIRRKLMQKSRDGLSRQDLLDIVGMDEPSAIPVETRQKVAEAFHDCTAGFGESKAVPGSLPSGGGRRCRYPEWDDRLNDYRQAYVKVWDQSMTAAEDRFYQTVLRRRQALIREMRRAFALIKPQGVSILRQWPEGDQFDYRSLLTYLVDKKAGLPPGEGLYIKRVKQRRDVAVLILVDLSRSTAAPVKGSAARVVDVEKESLVLLCEALDALGDRFAIAGFSGSGRQQVDYWRVKDFDEGLSARVRGRIDAMQPLRNTRMGAAIRHAAFQMTRVDAAVRLILVLGDGFPNDSGYKGRYAITDTRKAVSEARAMGIYLRALTVNMAAGPKLDTLYGKNRHLLITDIRQLPGRLPKIYSRLTKS